jgi:hypothetical protein
MSWPNRLKKQLFADHHARTEEFVAEPERREFPHRVG